MIRTITLLSVLLYAAAACSAALAAETPLDMPVAQPGAPKLTIQEIEEAVENLNTYIGGYPPRLSSEQQRNQVYETWKRALREARRQDKARPGSEQVLHLLAELYRQGHNLDVRTSADLAVETIDSCLARFPKSLGCNFSASYFYLSVNPKYAPKGEQALLTLRGIFAPDVNIEVERGLVYAYVMQQRRADALKQIDYYLTLEPGADWALQFKRGLEDGEIKLQEE